MGAAIPVKVGFATDAAQVAEHLDRLLKSDLLRRSASLTHLLQYLVDKAVHSEGEHLKESVIAIEVFHRSGDFDSRLDNIVRVHAHRLRKLLDTWYSGEGAGERIRFVIPKGSYMVRIQPNCAPAAPELTVIAEPIPVPKPLPVARPVRSRSYVLPVSLAAGAILGAAMLFLGLRMAGRIAPAKPPLPAPWAGVFRHGAETVVSFTNPAFLRTGSSPRVYVTYHGPLNAPSGAKLNVTSIPTLDNRLEPLGPFFFSDSWTGTGEIMAVQKLTEMADASGYKIRLIRSRALTYEDIKGSNVIFIGSPWANDMQAKFNIGLTPFQCFGTEKIVNNDPRNGEPANWHSEYNPTTNELSTTYALFSVLPGVGAGTRMASSSGIDTYATMAAVDYTTSATGVRELLRRFGTADWQILPDYFQAVIRTEIIRGEAAGSGIVAVRQVTPK